MPRLRHTLGDQRTMKPTKRRIKKPSRVRARPTLKREPESKGLATFGGGEDKAFGHPDAEDKGWGKS